jgi:hypothetical protein
MSLNQHKPSADGLIVHKPARNYTPRHHITMTDSQIVDHVHRFGYRVNIGQIAFTIESIADFVEARENFWFKAGAIRIYDPPGLLVVEDAMPLERQTARDILIVSLGTARAVMGVINPDHAAMTPRYAKRME